MFRSLSLCAFALFATAACDSDEVADAQEGASSLEGDAKKGMGGLLDKGSEMVDQGKEMGEDMAAKGTDAAKNLIAEAAQKLEQVEDSATAAKVSSSVTGLLEKLQGMKATLGNEMPDLAPLKDAASKLTTKFTGNEEVMAALKPVMDAIKKLGS